MSSSSVSFNTVISSPKSDSPYLQDVFGYPAGLVVDSAGSIIFVDNENAKIIKLNIEKGDTITIAGGRSEVIKDGKGLSANFNYPQGIAIDSEDVIYVGDVKSIRRISKDNVVSTLLSGEKVGDIQDIAYYEAEKAIYFVSLTFVSRIKSDGSNYTTWAGSSQEGYQDGKGVNARFIYASGISVNQITGDVYVSEFTAGRIRKIDRNQIVTTVVRGFWGPLGLHVIKNDSIIITEYFRNFIKKYSFETQKITVVAGTGGSGVFDGLGLDADLCRPSFVTWNPLNDDIVFIEWASGIRVINKFNYVSTILMPLGYGLEDGPSYKARISTGIGISMDEKEETIYFVDQSNNLLRKASLVNGTVTTMGGKAYSGNVIGNISNALFSNPSGIAYYNDTLLIADFGNNMIKKVSLETFMINDFLAVQEPYQVSIDQSKSSFYILKNIIGSSIPKYDMDGNLILTLGSGNRGCGDGYFNKATFIAVRDIYSMTDGTAFLCDVSCRTIRVFDPKTLYISLLAGKSETFGYADGMGKQALFGAVYGLDYYAAENMFYISDRGSNLVRKMTFGGNVTTYAGSVESGYRNGPIDKALFKTTAYIKVLSNGDVILCDDGNYAVRMIKKNEGIVETLFGYGSQKYHRDPGPNVDLKSPISITSKETKLYVLNKEDNNILGYDLKNQERFLFAGNGAIGWSDGDSIASMFNRPEDIHYSAIYDCLFVADTQNHLIRKVSMTGVVSTFAGTGKKGSRNDVLLASEFQLPSSITSDPFGNVFVADSRNNVIRKIFNGKVSIYAGTTGSSDLVNGKLLFAKFSFPTGIEYDRITGCLVVADMYNHVIRIINATHVSTLAGNGTSGYVDGPYQSALFAYPCKTAVDEKGIIYVTESYNDRIRKLSGETVSTLTRLKNPYGLHVRNGILYVSELSNNVIKSVVVGEQSTSVPSALGSDIFPVVGLSILCVLVTSLIVTSIWWIKVRVSLKRPIVTNRLQQIVQNHENVAKSNDKTGTITLKQPFAIAVPGYLSIDLFDSINFAEFGGKGGTAKVVLGTLKNPNLISKHGFVDVAVKVFDEQTNREDFLYEITVMSAFPKSNNIVELVGYSTDPLAIVMKSYATSLSDLISSGTYKNDSVVKLKIAVDIAKGMEIIHQCGVIHFDLKPANILIHYIDGCLNAVICDFGFANFSSDAKSNFVKGLKAPRTNGITARYAAPEQFQRGYLFNRLDMDVYKKVDVFAYAMTIYYVYTGTKPWGIEDKLDKIESRVCSGERPEIAEKVFPTEIRDLMICCWSQEPSERPSFTDLVKTLS